MKVRSSDRDTRRQGGAAGAGLGGRCLHRIAQSSADIYLGFCEKNVAASPPSSACDLDCIPIPPRGLHGLHSFSTVLTCTYASAYCATRFRHGKLSMSLAITPGPILREANFRPCGGRPLRVKVTGLAQTLGQLEAVNRDLQSKYWANLKLLGQPCNFYALTPSDFFERRGDH